MKYCKTCDGYGQVIVAYPVDEFQRAEPPDVDYCPDCDGIDRRNVECKVCFDSGTYQEWQCYGLCVPDDKYECTCNENNIGTSTSTGQWSTVPCTCDFGVKLAGIPIISEDEIPF